MTRAKNEGPRGVTLRTRAPLETHLSQPPASLPCNAHLDSGEGRSQRRQERGPALLCGAQHGRRVSLFFRLFLSWAASSATFLHHPDVGERGARPVGLTPATGGQMDQFGATEL